MTKRVARSNQPGQFMNLCREPVKMTVPRAAQALAPRAWQPQGLESEAYLNSTSQGSRPEDARKDGHIIRARYAPLSPASGFPVSRSEQPIHELSGLRGRVVFVPWTEKGDIVIIRLISYTFRRSS